jgi:hypothetical protein
LRNDSAKNYEIYVANETGFNSIITSAVVKFSYYDSTSISTLSLSGYFLGEDFSTSTGDWVGRGSAGSSGLLSFTYYAGGGIPSTDTTTSGKIVPRVGTTAAAQGFYTAAMSDFFTSTSATLVIAQKIYSSSTDVGFNLNLNHKNHTELSDKKYIVIFNGGSSANRKILKADMKLLIHQLTENYEQIVMIGGKTELLDETFYLSLSSKVLSYISKTSIKQTLSIINNAEAFISTDSGPLHFSLLTEQKKVIAIFGPGLDDKWCEKNRMKVLKKGLICQPCNYGRFSQTPDCPYDYLCLKNIDINLLLKYTNEGILR